MQKGANFTIVCTILLIGLNIKKKENFIKQCIYLSLIPYNKKTSLSLNNTEILRGEHVNL